MLNIVIADDEVRVCKLIQMLADWDALNMKVVGTAANGIEALELVETMRPDILITDIRMPGCDGLELIERARKTCRNLEIIIISGYAQFEYAQTAIRYDVGGYLLKPIKKEVLMTTLERLGQRCRQREDSAKAMDLLRNKSRDMQRDRLIQDLLQKKLDRPSGTQLTEEYGFPVQEGPLLVFILKMDCEPEKFSSTPVLAVSEKAAEIFESTVLPHCFSGTMYFYRSAGYGLLNFSREKQDDIRRVLRNFLNQMQAQKAFFGAVDFSLAISRVTEKTHNLPLSMQEAQSALCERLIDGNRRLLESIPTASHIRTQQILDKYNRSIDHAVDTLSGEEADKAVDELIYAVERLDDICGYELLELVVAAGRMFILRINMGEEAKLIGSFEEYCGLCISKTQLFKLLRSFQQQQIECICQKRENEAIRPIRLAKQYIQQHFCEPITLDDVCSVTGFSVSYFSTMFKRETGEGFSKYLTRVRIDHAKTLLQDTSLPVSEICEKVGYSDLKHFTGTFKKITNLNPGQYRKLYG